MKIEHSKVQLESKLQSQQIHLSTEQVVDTKHDFLAIVEENSYKSKIATQLLLDNDFNSKASVIQNNRIDYTTSTLPQDQCKKEIIENIIDRFFNTNNLTNSTITIDQKEEYFKKQTIDFHTSLEIQTSSQNYDMDLEISFSKELYEVYNSTLTLGNPNLKDPLVINYSENSNPFDNISTLKFEFDLNNDGKNENIPLLKKGAGFLSLDRNNNGMIDNGGELFGPTTGAGFEELAHYDQDKNNWIDENDAIFTKLKVWEVNEEKEEKLVSLLDLDIGAIYLKSAESGFEYQEKIDDVEAVQRVNGIYVKNDGSGVRMINALDIALETKN